MIRVIYRLILVTSLFGLIPSGMYSQSNIYNGLVFEALFSGHANDTSASYLLGKIVNAVLTADRYGNPNSAYAFNGLDAYIVYPHSEVMNFGPQDPFTISIWVKQAFNQNDLRASDNDVLSKWYEETGGGTIIPPYTGGYPFVLRVHNQTHVNLSHGAAIFGRWNGANQWGGCENSAPISSQSKLNDNQWHHFVLRKQPNSNLINIWVDGVNTGTVTDNTHNAIGGCTTKNNAPLMVGARYAGAFHFTGAIDDIRIWNRALSDEEIDCVYKDLVKTSIKEQLAEKITLFPNPAQGSFEIQSSGVPIESIELYDLTGRRIFAEVTNRGNTLRINSEHRGLSIVKIYTSKGWITQKVLLK